MKAFNKNKALNNIKMKKNRNTYIKRISIVLSCLILLIGIVYFTFAKFESSSDNYSLINGILDNYVVNNCSYNEGKVWNFDYTGDVQNFTVPCYGDYKIELWGSQGGYYSSYSDSNGANGGYTSGDIFLNKDNNLYIYVGGRSDGKNQTVFNNGLSSSGGWNGGGSTDVRLINGNWDSFNSIKSRIMVAGAGGTYYTTGVAGPGGGLIGYDGNGGIGGTQTSFGTSGYSPQASFGIANAGCTGGNGYYPGTGATCANGSGGGSSFISGYSGCNAISVDSTANNVIHTNQPNHYSGKVFTNSIMIDGKGCNWSSGSAANCGANQVQPNGTKTVGHAGNGYARITLLSKERLIKVPSSSCQYDIGYEWNYDYTGNVQSFNSPCNGNYKIELWGAQGGSSGPDGTGGQCNADGSNGSYTSGKTNIDKNTILYIYVGQHTTAEGTASFNGSLGSSSCGAAGGGATDVRTVNGTWNDANSLRSRVMVAAGGGNVSDTSTAEHSGAAYKSTNVGGGLIGGNGNSTYHTSANQTTGGTYNGGVTSFSGTNVDGLFGIGGDRGAGGGGGWYGGASGAYVNGGGTGGSSYISGHTGCVAITSTSSSTPKSGCTTGTTNNSCSISPYGYAFTNTKMVDGAGCAWTTAKGSCSGQEQPNGVNATGHAGHGYARITLISLN